MSCELANTKCADQSFRFSSIFFSRTPDPECRWFYPYEIIISHIPIHVPARGKDKKPNSRTSILDIIVMLRSCHLDASKLIPDEVEETLNSLSVGKAAGPDGINNRLLKQLSNPLSNPLSDLFNFSLAHGKVPTTWKEANITPIFKMTHQKYQIIDQFHFLIR